MLEERTELATLVADTLAWLDAWRRDGGVAVPDGALDGLPPPLAAPLRAAPSWAGPPAGPTPMRPPPRAASEAPPSGPGSRPEARVEQRPAGAGLFGGRWAAATETPATRLARVVAALPATCASCGGASPRGVGPVPARLVVLAAPLQEDAAVMFQKMLVHVLAMEPSDVWVVAPGACEACAPHVRAQVDALAPRLVLAMGDSARAAVGLSARGAWGRWAGADALATHHPDEVIAQLATGAQDARRATFEHLKELARRV